MNFIYPLTIVKGRKYDKIAEVSPAGRMSARAFINQDGESYLASSWTQPNKRKVLHPRTAQALMAKATAEMRDCQPHNQTNPGRSV